jgi:hypothetical protein
MAGTSSAIEDVEATKAVNNWYSEVKTFKTSNIDDF